MIVIHYKINVHCSGKTDASLDNSNHIDRSGIVEINKHGRVICSEAIRDSICNCGMLLMILQDSGIWTLSTTSKIRENGLIPSIPAYVGHEDDIQHPYDGVDGMGWSDANVEGMEGVNANVGVEGVQATTDLHKGDEGTDSDDEDSALNCRFSDSDDEDGDEGYFDNVGAEAPTGLTEQSEEVEQGQDANVANEQGQEAEHRVEGEEGVNTEQIVEPEQVVEENARKRKSNTGEASGSAKRKQGRPRKNRVEHNEVSSDPRASDFADQRESENDSLHFSADEDEELESGPDSADDEAQNQSPNARVARSASKNAQGSNSSQTVAATNPVATQMSNTNHNGKGKAVANSEGGCSKGRATQNGKGNAAQGAKGKAASVPHGAKGKATSVQQGAKAKVTTLPQSAKGKAAATLSTKTATRSTPKTAATSAPKTAATSAPVKSVFREKIPVRRPWK
ncbi:hypothetical protein RIF29_13541 [Crotalaria pallida]|uniref:Uncharacterized protein n=1 Tax=Crotalaria pallida TaxID=3830 RepID=A0AAN9IPD3_CROPI